MHPNDNEFDQSFRDRLRNHSSPVRGDLWRRIHTGIGTPARPIHLFRYWRYLGAGTITVALAAHLILTPSHPSRTRSVSHYSNIPAATTPATPASGATASPVATAKSPVTATPATPPSPGSGTTHSNSVSTYASANTAVTHVNTTTRDHAARNTTARNTTHKILTHKKAARTNPADLTTTNTSLARNPSTTPDNRAAAHSYNVTLPAIARAASRPAIAIHPTLSRTRRHNDLGPFAAANDKKPIRTGYISLYGSVDFPANHYYTWSGTVGGTVTIQFNRHWSGTAGIEYARANIPTQVVPPVGYGDTLFAFHFSNYEVPVLIGYSMMLGNFALTVNGGVIINIHSHQSNSPGNLVTSATSTWVFNWPNRDDFGAYLGADIFRPLSHSLRLFAQPYARFSVSDYRMFIPVQRFFYGAHAGIRYQL